MIKNAINFLIRRFIELIEIWSIRLIHIKTYFSYIFESKDNSYYVDTKKINSIGRGDGISGFYRVRNEEKFLEKSVESHIKYLDEIIIVYNNCSDSTGQIARNLEKKYPDKIKVYEYKPIVNPATSIDHILTPSKSIHSLANYYNFALSKTTKKIAVKIDADHIAYSEKFRQKTNEIRSMGLQTMLFFYGVNINIENNNIYINEKNPFTYGLDCGFFPVSRNTYFINRKNCESLRLPISMYFSRKSLGVLFYHLKYIKNDFDSNILIKNKIYTSSYLKNKHKWTQDIKLITLKEARNKYELLSDVNVEDLRNI